MRRTLTAGTGRLGGHHHRLASVAALIFLLCAGVNAAPAEKQAFATQLVVASAAFKSPGPTAASAFVGALKRAVPRGARARWGGERTSTVIACAVPRLPGGWGS